MSSFSHLRHAWVALLGSASWGIVCAAPATVIPLCPGLQVVTAVSSQEGDYESIKTIEAIAGGKVSLKYDSESNNNDLLGGPGVKKLSIHRVMRSADLDFASNYFQTYLEKSAEEMDDTTAIGTSTAVLSALKTRGESVFAISNAYAGLELSGDRSKTPNYSQYLQSGKIKRVGSLTLPVLVNGILTDLPAVKSEGDFVGDKAEFLFLDDVRNPLTLSFRIGIDAIKPLGPDAIRFCQTLKMANPMPGMYCDKPSGGDRDVLRVIKINFSCAAAPNGTPAPAGAGSGTGAAGGPGSADNGLEQALARGEKVDIYSIYFSFNSAEVRDESEPTLKQIAELMRKHPDWALRISGHTDSIGGDAANMDLSKRRAAAVQNALGMHFAIPANRFTTQGFGSSQPKDSNDSLEGRARNRRVELMRQ